MILIIINAIVIVIINKMEETLKILKHNNKE